MSVQSISHRTADRIARERLAIVPLGLAGVIAAIALALALALQGTPAKGSAVAGPTFDAVQFRAQERLPLAQPVFDAVQFRAQERLPLAQPVFDAVQFRAGERQALTPTFDVVQFRADERALR